MNIYIYLKNKYLIYKWPVIDLQMTYTYNLYENLFENLNLTLFLFEKPFAKSPSEIKNQTIEN